MAVTLRTLGLEDYDRWVELWRRAGLDTVRDKGRDGRESMARQFASGRVVMLGREDDGVLAGVLLVTHDERKGWLNRLAVLPEYRHRGYAGRLVRAAEDWLRGQGVQIFSALIEPHNDASLAMFKTLGYVEPPEPLHYVSRRDSPDA